MTTQKKSIAIVGAGPAGIAAALHAARCGCRVSLFESNVQVGKKLLVTGSGRCNITNMNAAPSSYTCADRALLKPLFNHVSAQALREILEVFGILTFSTHDGWCYPLSESAQSVVSLLDASLHSNKIDVHLGVKITDVVKMGDGFQIEMNPGELRSFDKVIVCAGGRAQPDLGARGELFPVLEQLGHTYLPLKPALAPVQTDMKQYAGLQGIRLDVIAKLWREKTLLAETHGNMIFTAWGMNGPAVMDLSHFVAGVNEKPLKLEIDLLNGRAVDLQVMMDKSEVQSWTVRILLAAFLPPKPAQVILRFANISETTLVKELSKDQISRMIGAASRLPFSVRGVRGFEYCQMKTGGVPLDEVDPETFESKIHAGLFLAGETLDVLGPCGGYNLHFAFASGWLAGGAAAK